MARNRNLRIHGDHAKVFSLSPKAQAKVFGHPLGFPVVKRKSTVPNPRGYSRAMSLAHVLFPNTFPEIIASGLSRPGEAHSRVTYTRRVKLINKSEEAIHENYNRKIPATLREKYKAHNKEVEQKVHDLEANLAEKGIFINHKPMNIGITKHGLVPFEVGMVNVVLLRKYIATMPTNSETRRIRKKQALHLLESLSKEADEFGFVVTHVEE